MLISFLKRSFVFAGSTVLFSAVRQLIFLPFVAGIDDNLFSQIALLVFTIDALIYSVAGSISDYYLRNYKFNEIESTIPLSLFSLLCLAFIPYFCYKGFGLAISLIISSYMVFISLNSLFLKPVFNRLKFEINYVYIIFRLAPYLSIIFLLKSSLVENSNVVFVFSTSLLLFECVFLALLLFFIYKKIFGSTIVSLLLSLRSQIHQIHIPKLSKGVLMFSALYLAMGYVQRADILLVETFYESDFVEYAKFFSVIGFFCNPIAMLFSSSLLSYISNKNISLQASIRLFFLPFFIMSLVVSLFSILCYPFVFSMLYEGESPIPTHYVGIIVLTTVLYLLFKTLVVKYSSMNKILISNVLLLGFSVLLISFKLLDLYSFVLTFVIARCGAYLACYIIEAKG